MQAACRDQDTRLFFPAFSGDINHQRQQAEFAIAICDNCVVKPNCEKANRDAPDGVFYGTVPAERGGPTWPDELRAEALQGVHYTVLMQKYGISRSQVYKIIKNQSRASKEGEV